MYAKKIVSLSELIFLDDLRRSIANKKRNENIYSGPKILPSRLIEPIDKTNTTNNNISLFCEIYLLTMSLFDKLKPIMPKMKKGKWFKNP